MDVLHCETEAGVLKELTIFAIVYNLVRLVMLEASRRQGVPLERISFVDALRWLSSSPPGTPLPELVVNPHRPGRVGAAVQEAASEETSLHEPAKKRPAATPARPTSSGLTGCHSGRAQIASNLTGVGWTRCRMRSRACRPSSGQAATATSWSSTPTSNDSAARSPHPTSSARPAPAPSTPTPTSSRRRSAIRTRGRPTSAPWIGSSGGAELRGLELRQVTSFVVGDYVEHHLVDKDGHPLSAPTKKQHLAGLRHFFDNQQMYHGVGINPASSVRGPKYSAREGKTPAFDDQPGPRPPRLDRRRRRRRRSATRRCS